MTKAFQNFGQIPSRSATAPNDTWYRTNGVIAKTQGRPDFQTLTPPIWINGPVRASSSTGVIGGAVKRN